MNKNSKANRRVLSNLRNTQSVSLSPPSLSQTLKLNQNLRFAASAAAATTVTDFGVLDLLCMASAANAAYSLCDAFRIKKVRVWAPMASNLSPVTVILEWSNQDAISFQSDATRHTDTSMGSARPAFISCKPPKGSVQGMWISTGNGFGLFKLTCPINTIVDFQVQLRVRDGTQAARAVNAAVAGATAGQVYCRSLDSTTSNLLVPVALSTI